MIQPSLGQDVAFNKLGFSRNTTHNETDGRIVGNPPSHKICGKF
jgi:hypothetical protein